MEEKQVIARLLLNKVTVNREGRVTIEFAIPELDAEPTPFGAFDTATPQRDGWQR